MRSAEGAGRARNERGTRPSRGALAAIAASLALALWCGLGLAHTAVALTRPLTEARPDPRIGPSRSMGVPDPVGARMVTLAVNLMDLAPGTEPVWVVMPGDGEAGASPGGGAPGEGAGERAVPVVTRDFVLMQLAHLAYPRRVDVGPGPPAGDAEYAIDPGHGPPVGPGWTAVASLEEATLYRREVR
jgi:hypothetical protein